MLANVSCLGLSDLSLFVVVGFFLVLGFCFVWVFLSFLFLTISSAQQLY